MGGCKRIVTAGWCSVIVETGLLLIKGIVEKFRRLFLRIGRGKVIVAVILGEVNDVGVVVSEVLLKKGRLDGLTDERFVTFEVTEIVTRLLLLLLLIEILFGIISTILFVCC